MTAASVAGTGAIYFALFSRIPLDAVTSVTSLEIPPDSLPFISVPPPTTVRPNCLSPIWPRHWCVVSASTLYRMLHHQWGESAFMQS